MHRKDFTHSIIGLSAMSTLSSFTSLTNTLKEQDKKMPVLFVGHGNPMNAIEDNEFTKGWKNAAAGIPAPAAILVISAHWETKGTYVTAMEKPRTIHDFGGFPKQLFDIEYPASGSKWLAEETKKEVTTTAVGLDEAWGLYHGAWSVLTHLYPQATIPVIQFSLDYTKNAQYHYDLAKELQALRKKGVLIIGSGNMVHNLSYVQIREDFNAHFGHDWAIEANESFKKLITDNDYKSLIDYKKYSKAFNISAPTPEHYLPMLYSIALREKDEDISFFNDALVGGSLSMTSLKIGS
jgi:4,5-DOPA dioxygenase extradiol